MTGMVRGLRTLGFASISFSLFTMRLAWEAVNMVLSEGEPPYDADVGLRRRWTRRELADGP